MQINGVHLLSVCSSEHIFPFLCEHQLTDPVILVVMFIADDSLHFLFLKADFCLFYFFVNWSKSLSAEDLLGNAVDNWWE